ncbi:unnamed protein product [Phytophthora lilii]|uniref:Unnamed protein product n=1 Tax=Phytophthora lilii TaxID=2077276 RepID=A0A9W6X334_9STRA|nr:unnamed protein product [Phytophthora lilii]
MVTLCCVVVGVARSAFPVDINASLSVGHLKEAIKERRMFRFPAYKMQLFVAKKDGVWLPNLTEDVKKLMKGEKTAFIKTLTHEDKEMQAEYPISEYLEGMEAPKVKHVHVLVVVHRRARHFRPT